MIVPDRFRYLAPRQAELLRVGRNADGGYVIAVASIEASKGLISLGLSSEWSFDKDFLKRKPGIHYCAVDRSSGFLVYGLAGVRHLVSPHPRVKEARKLFLVALRFLQLVPPIKLFTRRRFKRRWVRAGVIDKKRDLAIRDLFSQFPVKIAVFLKIDVEGSEYDLLPEIIALAQGNPELLSGMCVEFHNIARFEDQFHSAISELKMMFDVVHVHANNCVPVTSDFPDVVEVSFSRKSQHQVRLVKKLPNPLLDFPNDSTKVDISLEFE